MGLCVPTTANRLFINSPLTNMLYKVRLQYGFNVDASDKSAAFRIATRMLRDNPGAFVSQVEQADKPKGNPSLVKRVITGQ